MVQLQSIELEMIDSTSLIQGSNWRFFHTYIDEDSMGWLKRDLAGLIWKHVQMCDEHGTRFCACVLSLAQCLAVTLKELEVAPISRIDLGGL